jgi:hypothetical protein
MDLFRKRPPKASTAALEIGNARALALARVMKTTPRTQHIVSTLYKPRMICFEATKASTKRIPDRYDSDSYLIAIDNCCSNA